MTLGLGTTETINVNDAIKFNDPTIGGIVSNQIYYIVNILSSTTFAVSENLNEDISIANGIETEVENKLLIDDPNNSEFLMQGNTIFWERNTLNQKDNLSLMSHFTSID